MNMTDTLMNTFVMTVGLSTLLIGGTFVVNGAKNPIKELEFANVGVGTLLMFIAIRTLYGQIMSRTSPNRGGMWR